MYGSEQAWAGVPNVSWKPGGSLTLHHGGDLNALRESGWWLDPDRSWKTRWSFQTGKTHGGDSLYHANKWGMTGGYAGWDEDRDRYHRIEPGDRAAYTTGKTMQGYAPGIGPSHKGIKSGVGGVALQQIDWKAYDRDPQYKSWLKETGKERFNTLQDIYDAEEFIQTGSKKHQNELAELKAQLEKEKLLREEMQRSNTPEKIDTSSSPQPVGGVGTIQPVPGVGGGGVGAGGMSPIEGVTGHDWLNSPEYAQQRAEMEQQLKARDAAHTQSIADLQSQWGAKSAAELEDFKTSLTSQFSEAQATRDQQYQSQIADLTSNWDAEKADWKAQQAANQAAWGEKLGGLETSLSEANKRNEAYQNEMKKFQEMQIRDQERQRMAARYGAGGSPMNPSVKGVKTGKLGYLGSGGYHSPRGMFNRGGLRITNLNI